MQILIPALVIFISVVTVIELVMLTIRNARDPFRRTVRKRLKKMGQTKAEKKKVTDIRRQQQELSKFSFFQKLFQSLPGVDGLSTLLKQADCRYNLGTVVLFSFFIGLVSALAFRYLRVHLPLAIAGAVLFTFIPWLVLLRKRRILFEKFKRQLPEAANLIARSLRAGHSLPAGIGMVAEEFDSPIGPVFKEVVEEINYGGSVTDALRKVSRRFDTQETHFLVMGVTLQRETGGNMAEILDNLSKIMRERFRLEARIKILSAEAKWTAWGMLIVPVALFVIMHIIRREHTEFLLTDPIGRMALTTAVILTTLGFLVMRKMINFKI